MRVAFVIIYIENKYSSDLIKFVIALTMIHMICARREQANKKKNTVG